MKKKAISNKKTLVLAEGLEERTVRAARKILDEKIASKVILVGKEDEINKFASKLDIDVSDMQLSNPLNNPLIEKFVNEYYELRKSKGVTMDDAKEKMKNSLFWAAMLTRLGYADSMIAGAENTTADVLRSAFQIIKTAPGIKSASSCFVMITDKKQYGCNGSFIFSDCATIPNPSAEQLVEIAACSAESCRKYLLTEPVISFLSYSSKGSASGELVEKVQTAVSMFKEKYPNIKADGELQLDASIVESVAKTKAKGSSVAGHANVLIFPDLQAGNIGYKLVQRLAGAEAFGPILQGFAKPVSDLSRGCSVDDIVSTAALTLS